MYSWQRRGNIFIRITDDSPTVRIKTKEGFELHLPGVLLSKPTFKRLANQSLKHKNK